MPKNFVGRLLNLENEMKNVLSICEISSSEQKVSKPAQKKGRIPVRSSSNADYRRPNLGKEAEQQAPRKTEKPSVRPKQQPKVSSSQRKNPPIEKPSSAPPGALCTINETENNIGRKGSVQYAPKKGEGTADADSLEYFDCSPQACTMFEQTLRPAEEILSDIAHYGNDNYYPNNLVTWCQTCGRRAFDCVCHQWETQYNLVEYSDKKPEDTDEESRESFIQHIKPDLKDNTVINELARKIERKEMEALREERRKFPQRSNLKELKSTEDKRQQKCQEGLELTNKNGRRRIARPMTAPAMTRGDDTRPIQEVINRNVYLENDGQENPENPQMNVQEWHLGEKENEESIIDEESYMRWMKDAMDEQQESASDAESSAKLSEDLKNLKYKKNLSDATTRKIAEIIEKNHEKIEKMRRSRFTALNAVKCIKEKYDALSHMKNDMQQKMAILMERKGLKKDKKQCS